MIFSVIRFFSNLMHLCEKVFTLVVHYGAYEKVSKSHFSASVSDGAGSLKGVSPP